MSLKTIQEGFIQQLIDTQLPDEFIKHLKPCCNLLPEEQLAIYQNNVRGALQKTLAQVYPVCRKILGENYFKQLAGFYIRDNPSKNYDLNAYGGCFSDFLRSECLSRNELNDFPYLGDLAQLEWFREQVYYAADGAVFDFSAFAQLSEQQHAQSVFQLLPCLMFISSEYPILSIWQMNQQNENIQATVPSEAESCCVFRKNNHIEMMPVDTKIYSLLVLIRDGANLDKIVQTGFADYLPELINRGWVDGFKVKHV